jgi:type IV pilus assembly protein PilM
MIRALAGIDESVERPDAETIPVADRAAVLYANVGDTTNLAVARDRTCLFTRVSPVGLEGIAGGLVSGVGMSLEHAKLWLSHVGLSRRVEEVEGDPVIVARTREALQHGAASLVDELRLSLDFYAAQETAVPIERIVLCGPGSAISGLAEQMEDAIGMPIAVGRPTALSSYEAATAARLTLPLGLALDV